MNFQWSFFEFTNTDCQNVGMAIKATPTLEVFRLRESKVSNEQARVLVLHLLDHPGLTLLGMEALPWCFYSVVVVVVVVAAAVLKKIFCIPLNHQIVATVVVDKKQQNSNWQINQDL